MEQQPARSKHLTGIARATQMALLLVPVVVGVSPSSWADPEPTPRLRLQETLGGSVNNVALQNTLTLSWTWPLTASTAPLRKDARLALGLSNATTPSYSRVGVWAEVSPLSVLDLRIGVEPAVYFGTFGSLMSFQEYSDDFSIDARKAMGDLASSGAAGRVYATPTLKMKVGPVVASVGADFEWWKSNASGPLFYEPARDTLLKAAGAGLVRTSSVLLYQHERADTGKLMAGFNHTLTYVFDAPANRVQRVGVLAVREFSGTHLGLKRPRVITNLFYYLEDPSKRHQMGAALAVTFDVTR